MNNYRKLIFPLTIFIVFITLFFISPSEMSGGVRKGLTVCGGTIIPSLFPFMVISDFFVRSGSSNAVGRVLSPLTEKAFRLPGCSACAVFMSLIGGFPVGAKIISQLYENNSLTKSQAQRMIRFCVNSGPAFVVSAIGASMLSSKKCGIILFASQTVTSLLIGFLSRFSEKNKTYKADESDTQINPFCLTESVACSTESMINVCSWIILFSALTPFLVKLSKINLMFNVLVLLSEVTEGCSVATKTLPVYFLAPVLCWSGLAVHMQLLPYLKKIGISLPEFWLSRVANSVLSLPVAFCLFKLFPCDVQTFSSFDGITVQPYSVSVPASVAMLVLGVFTIIDINLATNKKI